MEHTVKKDKMAVMPIKRLMLSMSIPMILSMVLQAVYNDELLFRCPGNRVKSSSYKRWF